MDLINNSTDYEQTMQFVRLAMLNQASKNTVWAAALLNLNKYFQGRLATTKPEFTTYTKKDIVITAGAAHPLGTFSAATPANLTLAANGEKLIVWDNIEFGSMLLNVVAVNGNTPSVVLLAGTDVAIADEEIGKLEDNASAEGENGIKERGYESPTKNYNLTQIIDASGKVTGTDAVVKGWQSEDAINECFRQASEEFTRKLHRMVSSKYRAQYVQNGKVIRKAGWLTYFMKNNFHDLTGELTGVRDVSEYTVAVGGNISVAKINAAFVKAYNNWGTINTLAGTAQRISDLTNLENNKISISVENGQATNATNIGWGLQRLASPINVDGNQIDAILVTDEFGTDELLAYDRNALSIESLRPAIISTSTPTDATRNGKDDNYRLHMSWEVTLIPEHFHTSFILLTGITDTV